jgi:hypothetical protein
LEQFKKGRVVDLLPVPRVGDTIYVDDVDVVHQTYVRGGWATVSEVRDQNGETWVSVAEMPGTGWSWQSYLAPMQDDLRECFGGTRAGKYIMNPRDATE